MNEWEFHRIYKESKCIQCNFSVTDIYILFGSPQNVLFMQKFLIQMLGNMAIMCGTRTSGLKSVERYVSDRP